MGIRNRWSRRQQLSLEISYSGKNGKYFIELKAQRGITLPHDREIEKISDFIFEYNKSLDLGIISLEPLNDNEEYKHQLILTQLFELEHEGEVPSFIEHYIKENFTERIKTVLKALKRLERSLNPFLD